MREPEPPRRPYTKPEVVRVDLIEDEVALVVCKSIAPQTKAKVGGAPAGCKARNCKQDGFS